MESSSPDIRVGMLLAWNLFSRFTVPEHLVIRYSAVEEFRGRQGDGSHVKFRLSE